MKKITLALFSVVCFFGSVLSQPNITIQAPPANTGSINRLPNGTNQAGGLKGCYLIKKTELTALTGSIVNSIDLTLQFGTGSPAVTGNFTLYLQNTLDATYLKGTSFSAALTGMTPFYTSGLTIPLSTAASTINLPFTPNFTYTGNGIYVAVVWDYAGTAFATNPAQWDANFISGGGLGATSYNTPTPAANTMTVSDFRPAFVFHAVNTATNESAVLNIIAPGSVAKLFNTPHNVTTVVKNSSIGTLTGIAVTLSVTGANPFSDVQTISSLAGGASTLITFAPYNPTTNGVSNMSVSIAADQNPSNNLMVWSQSVTCNEVAQHPANVVYNSSFGYGGTSGSGYFLAKHRAATSASLTNIRVVVGAASSATANGYGVLVDATGALIATSSNTLSMAPSTTVTFNFPSIALTGATDYYFGLAQPAANNYPLAEVDNPLFVPPAYYNTPIGGGAIVPVTTIAGYLGITPVLSFSSTAVHASASKTIVCKKDGPNTVTLTATGLSTYTWTGGATGSVVAVTPSIAGTSTGVVVYTVTGTDGVSGCKGTVSSVIVTVSNCTGLASNTSNGYDLKVFPNPAVNGKSTITGLAGTNNITVFNSLGQVVLNQLITDETTSIDLSNQPSGNYLIKITDQNSESRTIKVVNQN